MPMHNLSKAIKITKVKAASTADTAEVVSDAIDMQGYEGCLIFTTVATANAGNYLKVAQDSAVGLGTKADLAGSKVVCTHGTDILFVDVYRPTKRYLAASVVRGASTAVGEIFALRYRGAQQAETNVVSNLSTGVLLASPAEGTA
jgi:hypothetical protein